MRVKKDEAQALTPVAGVGSVWNVKALLINSQLSCTDPSAFFGLTQNATKGSKGVFLKGDAFFFPVQIINPIFLASLGRTLTASLPTPL